MRRARGALLLTALALFLCQQTHSDDGERLRTQDMDAARSALNRMAGQFGGWENWYATLRPFHDQWKSHINTAPDLGHGVFAGDTNYLFLRTWEDYLLEPGYVYKASGSARETPSEALKTLIKMSDQFRQRGIHFIVAPVPARSEICPELAMPGFRPLAPPAPQRAEFLAHLLANNVEAIDLLPALLAGKRGGDVILKNDTHWSSYGAALAAREIANRLDRYDWQALYGRRPEQMERVDTVYERSWALYDRLTDENKVRYPAGPVPISQVRRADGSTYADVPDAPLLMTGDSFLFFFGRVQANVAAHVAANIGYPISTLPLGGGQAAGFARKFARLSPEALARHKVIVFVFLAPYLRYDNWATAPLPDNNEQDVAQPARENHP